MFCLLIPPPPPNASAAVIENYHRLHDEQDREMMVWFWIHIAVFGAGLIALVATGVMMVGRLPPVCG